MKTIVRCVTVQKPFWRSLSLKADIAQAFSIKKAPGFASQKTNIANMDTHCLKP
jgi:hypothetical protein